MTAFEQSRPRRQCDATKGRMPCAKKARTQRHPSHRVPLKGIREEVGKKASVARPENTLSRYIVCVNLAKRHARGYLRRASGASGSKIITFIVPPYMPRDGKFKNVCS